MTFVRGQGCPVGGFLGAEASAGSFLGAGVGPWRAHGDEVTPVGDLGGQVGEEVGEVTGLWRSRRLGRTPGTKDSTAA
jgi:hypothetical protein